MTLRQIAAVMGVNELKARKFLHRRRALLPSPRYGRLGQPKMWPVSIIEDIRALHGQQHEVADPQSDWLARYLKEGPHAPKNRTEPPSQC